MPQVIGWAVSRKLATLHELDSVYSVEDLWDLLEIAAVDDHNATVMAGENR